MISASTLSDRRGLLAFILGVIAVTAGVLMHVPMFLMGQHNHFMLAGMPMGADMIVGMALIVGGVGVAAYGLLPRNVSGLLPPRRRSWSRRRRTPRSPERIGR